MPDAARKGDDFDCRLSDGNKPHRGGTIDNGAPSVRIGGQLAAVAGSICRCQSPLPNAIITGSASVLIENRPAARKGDPTVHGGSIKGGEASVQIGDTPSHGASASSRSTAAGPATASRRSSGGKGNTLVSSPQADAKTERRDTAADLKDDDSTDIEILVTAFAKDLTAECERLRNARLELEKAERDAGKGGAKQGSKPARVKVVTFSMSRHKSSKSRTPREQAREVLRQGKGGGFGSYVCWSSHMTDRARHVLMKVDGEPSWGAKNALGKDFKAFKQIWGDLMKRYTLKNAAGRDGWGSWDQFHLELPNSKIARTDERALACLDEYARLTREENMKKNTKFEKDYAALLKSYIEKYEKPPGGESDK